MLRVVDGGEVGTVLGKTEEEEGVDHSGSAGLRGVAGNQVCHLVCW